MIRHNKLVRDKIPAICDRDGYETDIRIIQSDMLYLDALMDKLDEEVEEIKDCPSVEELADALEVIQCIGKFLGYTPSEIEAARMKKAEANGGFDNRIYLISTVSRDSS